MFNMKILELKKINPFVRCVGTVKNLIQKNNHVAFDFRMIVALDSKGIIETQNSVVPFEKNEVCIIPPGVPYRVESTDNQEILVINFDMTDSHSDIDFPVISVKEELFDESEIIENFDLSLLFGERGFVKRKVAREDMSLFVQILEAYNRRTQLENVYMSGLLKQIIYKMAKGMDRKENSASEVYGYIGVNFHLPLTLSSVAEEFHFHPTYVNRLLKKHYNISFRQHLLNCRFEKALQLIDNTELSIKEISASVGFNDAQYFSNAFYKHFGKYPSFYRK